MYLPYVYIVTNRNTGKFYIGMRSANKVIAEQDLGKVYFTSSKEVRNNFHQYEIQIVAYFKDQISAFEFENRLIEEHWGNPLLLNKHYQKSMSSFSMTGSKRPDLADYNKKSKSKPKEERTYSCVICNGIFTRTEFVHHPRKEEFVCGHKCNGARSGKKSTGRSNPKFSEYRRSNPVWNKGLPNPQAAENGRKSAAALSVKVTGRKKVIRNGKSTWAYPGDNDYPTTSVTEQVGTISES